MTHPAVQRARCLLAVQDTEGMMSTWEYQVQDLLAELVEAYEALEAEKVELVKKWGKAIGERDARAFELDELASGIRRDDGDRIYQLTKEHDRVVALNTRLTAALRNVMTLVDTDDIWRASGFAKDARALLAETEKTR